MLVRVVYQRDNSWYSSHGRGGCWHFLGRDLASACGRARMLDIDNPRDQNDVPVQCCCRAKGCVEKWERLLV